MGHNRLADETSPYLLQHEDNPVHWWAWGDDAFQAARGADKPILLSVGYAACHWCHVMAHESFEGSGTAAVMNKLFVNIKVDREERRGGGLCLRMSLSPWGGASQNPPNNARRPPQDNLRAIEGVFRRHVGKVQSARGAVPHRLSAPRLDSHGGHSIWLGPRLWLVGGRHPRRYPSFWWRLRDRPHLHHPTLSLGHGWRPQAGGHFRWCQIEIGGLPPEARRGHVPLGHNCLRPHQSESGCPGQRCFAKYL